VLASGSERYFLHTVVTVVLTMSVVRDDLVDANARADAARVRPSHCQ